MKNVIIIMTGTALAQSITFICIPLITRLYEPGEIGILGSFTAIMTILAPLACLTYPISMILPKSELKSRSIAKLSLILSLIIALLMTSILFLFSKYIIEIFKLELISDYIFLFPIFIIITAFYQVMEQWLIRIKNFKALARTAVLQSVFINGSKLGMGYIYPFSGPLIIIQILGVFLGAIMMFLTSKGSVFYKFKEILFKDIKEVARENRDFPIYRAPQIFINAISQGLPVILFASFFGPAVAGFYTIGRQSLNTPVLLLGKAVQDVLYPKANEIARSKRPITPIIMKALTALFMLGVIPVGVIVVWGPEIFSFVFGDTWVIAGEYAKWIALVSISMLITKPILTIIPVLGIQKMFLVVEIIGTAAKIVSLFIGIYLFNEAIHAIILFSVVSILMYLYLTCHTLIECRKLDRKNLT